MAEELLKETSELVASWSVRDSAPSMRYRNWLSEHASDLSKAMSVLRSRGSPPEYESFAAKMETAKRTLRDALEHAGMCEHRLAVTGDKSGYKAAIDAVNDAAKGLWMVESMHIKFARELPTRRRQMLREELESSHAEFRDAIKSKDGTRLEKANKDMSRHIDDIDLSYATIPPECMSLMVKEPALPAAGAAKADDGAKANAKAKAKAIDGMATRLSKKIKQKQQAVVKKGK